MCTYGVRLLSQSSLSLVLHSNPLYITSRPHPLKPPIPPKVQNVSTYPISHLTLILTLNPRPDNILPPYSRLPTADEIEKLLHEPPKENHKSREFTYSADGGWNCKKEFHDDKKRWKFWFQGFAKKRKFGLVG